MMQIFRTKEFDACIKRAIKFGGQAAQGTNKALQAISLAEIGVRNPLKGMKKSNNPDDRLKGMTKYHPNKNYRLVTVQNGDVCIFVFYGDHNETDKWLDSNKGRAFSFDETSGEIHQTTKTSRADKDGSQAIKPQLEPRVFHGILWDKFPEEKWDKLTSNFPLSLIRPLIGIEAGIESDELLDHCDALTRYERDNPDTSKNSEYPASEAIFDILVNLGHGAFEEADAVLELYLSNQIEFTESSIDEDTKINDSASVKRFDVESEEFKALLNGSLTASNLEWLLFTHPDQQRFVDEDYAGSALLQGVSGSGKTGILVKRAVRLAKASNANVLIVTLNDSLALVLSDLVKLAVHDEDIYERIEVYSYFQLCQMKLRELDPKNQKSYTRVTDITDQHSDEIFREYYRCETNNKSAEVMLPVHRSLSSRGIDAERYISDEFDWMRSAIAPDNLQSYLNIERRGRKVPLNYEYRAQIMNGLIGWKKKMSDVGVMDDAEISHKMYEFLNQLKPEYTNILIDESQDLGTLELIVLRKLAHNGNNDLFFAADMAQTILPKTNDFNAAKIAFEDRVFSLQKNYRNSREILTTAREILWESLDEDFINEKHINLLEPDFANRSSDLPRIIEADSLGQEIAAARLYCEDYLANINPGATCCIILAGYTNLEVSNFGEEIGLKTLDIRGSFKDESITLSDMETVKGLEFDIVYIVNCNDQNLPNVNHAKEESYRDACLLYVAMTRAKHRLLLSYSGSCSSWLDQLSEPHEDMHVSDMFDADEITATHTPSHLAEVTDPDEKSDNPVLDMTGDRFEYTSYARSIPSNILQWISKHVNGENSYRKQGDHNRTDWETLRLLLSDMKLKKQHDIGPAHFFSKEADDTILQLLEAIEINERRDVSGSTIRRIRPNFFSPFNKETKKPAPQSKAAQTKKLHNNDVSSSAVDRLPLKQLPQLDEKLVNALRAENIITVGNCKRADLKLLLRNPAFNSKSIKLLEDIETIARSHLVEKEKIRSQNKNAKKNKTEALKAVVKAPNEYEIAAMWILKHKPLIDDIGIMKLSGIGRVALKKLRSKNLAEVTLPTQPFEANQLAVEVMASHARRLALQKKIEKTNPTNVFNYNPYDDK